MPDSSDPSEQSGTQAFPIVVSATPAEPPAASTDLAAPGDQSDALALARELRPAQQRVLQEMVRGSSITEASKATGISCRQISRWVNDDPRFIAAFNAWKNEQLEYGRASALAMTGDIMGTLHNAVLQGNASIAYRMARDQGMLKASKPGPTDAGEVERRREIRRARQDHKLLDAEHEHDLDFPARVERHGIAWTSRALRRLSDNEQSLLKFLQDKVAGREHRDCSEFSPLDHDRHLTDWERGALLKAREQVVLEGNMLFHGHVLPVPRGMNGVLIHYSKRQMFNMLRKGCVPEDEAMQLLANYRRPHPGFYEPNDLPYAEDQENAGETIAPAAESTNSVESEPPATNA